MKKVWIFNHYAGPPSLCAGLRHYYFSKYLVALGYKVTVFAASSIHNGNMNLISDSHPYSSIYSEGINFVFLKARSYSGNGVSRVLNMTDYYRGLMRHTVEFEKPDIIIGSSVHPLACVAAITLSRRYGCKCIAEVRDLWPESIVAYEVAASTNPIVLGLYQLEKWIYTKAERIIFTMEGGRDYIVEKRWDTAQGGPVDLTKVRHINNGVDLRQFQYDREQHSFSDPDLDSPNTFKVVYTGSIRKANNLGLIIEAATFLNSADNDIIFLIFGDGDQKVQLEATCARLGLHNVRFKGRVDKKRIPFILSKADVSITDMYESPLFEFGVSPNKLFEYMASGKPILSGIRCKYDIVSSHRCGLVLDTLTAEEIVRKLRQIRSMTMHEHERMRQASLAAVAQYDYSLLTSKLAFLIEEVLS